MSRSKKVRGDGLITVPALNRVQANTASRSRRNRQQRRAGAKRPRIAKKHLAYNLERESRNVSEDAKVNGVRIQGLLDVAEMADWIGVEPDCLRDLVHAGKVPCIMFNPRLWRFDLPTVQRALEKLTVR